MTKTPERIDLPNGYVLFQNCPTGDQLEWAIADKHGKVIFQQDEDVYLEEAGQFATAMQPISPTDEEVVRRAAAMGEGNHTPSADAMECAREIVNRHVSAGFEAKEFIAKEVAQRIQQYGDMRVAETQAKYQSCKAKHTPVVMENQTLRARNAELEAVLGCVQVHLIRNENSSGCRYGEPHLLRTVNNTLAQGGNGGRGI